MKKLVSLVLALFLVISLSACGGNVKDVERIICGSEQYSKLEINSAMNAVTLDFKKNFGGCTLLELRYDEYKTAAAQEEYSAHYGGADVIIITSSFITDENGGDKSCFNPNGNYTNYKWILSRSLGGEWKIKDRGY